MSILNRTVYYDNTGGTAMFWDWAKVTTTLGVCAEPFFPGQRSQANLDYENFEPNDEINRIDIIRALPIDKAQVILSGGDNQHTMGGVQSPRNDR